MCPMYDFSFLQGVPEPGNNGCTETVYLATETLYGAGTGNSNQLFIFEEQHFAFYDFFHLLVPKIMV